MEDEARAMNITTMTMIATTTATNARLGPFRGAGAP
jgi:hypothetical protein